MNLIEKNLYQQIHPLRLATDWISGFVACYLFWQQEVAGGIIIAFIPSLFVSLVLMRFVELEKVKNSAFGRYYKRTHKQILDTLRLAGFAVMAIGSYNQSLPAAAAGLLLIIGTWTIGIFQKK
ncbi:MAG: hypothetical protein HUU02_04965 [Bacteroidetes bacterium]|nr:hypothetical protein [Bacteroidota bacterium]